MPLVALAAHCSSKEGALEGQAVRLVSVKGVVFDVSQDAEFQIGVGKLAALAGHDASRFIALAGGAEEGAVIVKGGTGRDGLVDAGLEGLRYEEHQRLESYFVEMARARRAVAVLADPDHVRYCYRTASITVATATVVIIATATATRSVV